jgi:aldose 1-epimerase
MQTGSARRRRRQQAAVLLGGLGVLAVGATTAGSEAVAASRNAPSERAHAALSVSEQSVGSVIEPYTGQSTTVDQYTLTNDKGMSVQILTYGGIVQDVEVPNRHGQTSDVVLGFKTLEDYVDFDSPPVTANGGPYFGELIGRYGNRIAGGKFTLDQPGVGPVTYTLPINNGVNDLHGGLVGFGNHVWAAQPVRGAGYVGVQLTLVSPNGDQTGAPGSPGCPNGCTGFPAQLQDVTTYTLDNDNELEIHYRATNQSSNLNTVVNLTSHSYFNLAGENAPAGSAYGQYVQINADKYLPTDTTQIPLGYEASVAGTPFDFTTPQTIGSRIDDVSANTNSPGYNQLLIAQGYDHNWVLNAQTPATTGPDGLNLAARAYDPVSGRRMTVWTDQPGVQFYTGNFLNGTLTGISGNTYRQGAGYC